MASQQTIRRIVWTGSIVAVTATGAWYGAGLKMQSEHKQVCFPYLLPSCPLYFPCLMTASTNKAQEIQRRRKASPTEKIAQLEEARGALIAKRIGLENKIYQLEMRSNGATREESMIGQERRR